MEVYPSLPEPEKIRRIEVAPLAQVLGLRDQGGPLGAQILTAIQHGPNLCIQRFKVPVGEELGSGRLGGVLVEGQLGAGEVGNPLEARRVGGLLFADMDQPQLAKPVQQRLLLGGLGHDGDDLHFFNHVATSRSLFLAILPRTTAAVCWSPR